MQWIHNVSADWLKARRDYVTASEVKNIVSVTNTGRKRSEAQIRKACIDLYASKHTNVFETESRGAAARGHILEPYAIQECGGIHVDDVLLYNINMPGLAYSPDGLDIEIDPSAIDQALVNAADLPLISRVYEAKCYSPEKHLALLTTSPNELEERWQLTAAMMVVGCKQATLVGFNPDMDESLQVISMTMHRCNLQKEETLIREAIRMYVSVVKEFEDSISTGTHATLKPASITREQIIKEYQESLVEKEESLKKAMFI